MCKFLRSILYAVVVFILVLSVSSVSNGQEIAKEQVICGVVLVKEYQEYIEITNKGEEALIVRINQKNLSIVHEITNALNGNKVEKSDSFINENLLYSKSFYLESYKKAVIFKSDFERAAYEFTVWVNGFEAGSRIIIFGYDDVPQSLKKYNIKYSNLNCGEFIEDLHMVEKPIELIRNYYDEAFGVECVILEDLKETGFDGIFYVPCNGCERIVIDRSLSSDYKQYVICHELIHAVMWNIADCDNRKFLKFELLMKEVDYKNIEIPLTFQKNGYEHTNIDEFLACVVGEWLYNECSGNPNENEVMNYWASYLFSYEYEECKTQK